MARYGYLNWRTEQSKHLGIVLGELRTLPPSSEFKKKIVGNVGVNYKSSFENIRKTSGNRRESSESGQKGSNNLGGNLRKF